MDLQQDRNVNNHKTGWTNRSVHCAIDTSIDNTGYEQGFSMDSQHTFNPKNRYVNSHTLKAGLTNRCSTPF